MPSSLFPLVRASGSGGSITLEGGKVVGTLGAWRLQYFGDDKPFLTASGCKIAAYWRSAGVQRLTCRPRSAAGASPLTITGDVKLITDDRLSLGSLTIEGLHPVEENAS